MFRPNPGAPTPFQRNSSPSNTNADYCVATDRPAPGTRLVTRSYAWLAEYTEGTRQDDHSVALDYDGVLTWPRLDAKDNGRAQDPLQG